MILGASLARTDLSLILTVLKTQGTQTCGELGAFRGQAFLMPILKVFFLNNNNNCHKLQVASLFPSLDY
jgi:hypothetical protein